MKLSHGESRTELQWQVGVRSTEAARWLLKNLAPLRMTWAMKIQCSRWTVLWRVKPWSSSGTRSIASCKGTHVHLFILVMWQDQINENCRLRRIVLLTRKSGGIINVKCLSELAEISLAYGHHGLPTNLGSNEVRIEFSMGYSKWSMSWVVLEK